jgi:hypothetical protein
MSDHDAGRNASLAHEGHKREADRLQAEKIDLLGVAPSRVIFAEAGLLDERKPLELGGVRL